MKKAFLLFGLGLAVTFGATQAKNIGPAAEYVLQQAKTLTQITWDAQEINLGVIAFQKPKTVVFQFTNTGKNPLVIAEVKTTCGCTVAEYSKEPIMPGKKGTISAMYSAGTKGPFHKSMTVVANIPQKQVDISIRGEVK